MKEPVFMNSCGILSEDCVTFAFENGEKNFPLNDIENLKIKTKTNSKSVIAVVLILCLMTVLAATNNWIRKNLLITAGILFFCLLLVSAAVAYNRQTYIVLKLKENRKFIIRVADRNKKEATKFIARAVRQKEISKAN